MSAPSSGESLRAFIQELVGHGKKLGADEVEVTFQEGDEFSLDIRQGEIENITESGSRAVSLKIILDQRTALAASSDLTRETLFALIENAVQRARLATPDPHAGLPSFKKEDPVDAASLDIFDPALAALDTSDKIRMAQKTERIALADPRISNSHGASFDTREVQVLMANSSGLLREYSETYCTLGVGLQAGDTDSLVEGYWGCAKRYLADLESPETIAHKAVERTVRQLGSRKIPTQNAPVLFEPEMTSWLMGFLFACVSGIAIYNRSSFLVDRLGELVADPAVNVIDDGLLPRGLGSSPFDADGVPCRNTPVLQAGILKNYLCNTYAARKLGLASTGNASGTGVGPTNFYMTGGSMDPEHMRKTLERGLILIRVLGHGMNPVTGDISRGAFGLWVENGEIVHPVSEITITGNLGDVLKNIRAVGNDLEFRSSLCGPSLLTEGFTIAGI